MVAAAEAEDSTAVETAATDTAKLINAKNPRAEETSSALSLFPLPQNSECATNQLSQNNPPQPCQALEPQIPFIIS